MREFIETTFRVCDDPTDQYHGWAFAQHADGQWVTVAKLDDFTIGLLRCRREFNANQPATGSEK